MSVNPFKDANLDDLQKSLHESFRGLFGRLIDSLSARWKHIKGRSRERVTIMVIPHSEKRIINLHVSLFSILVTVIILTITVSVTSVIIVHHSSSLKEVSKLKSYGVNSRVKVQKYREEINRLYASFQQFKPELTHLYSLTPGSNIDSLWAKGGVPNSDPGNAENSGEMEPTIEMLNLEEIENELKTSRQVLHKVKEFLEYRRKIIENTPSIWPVEGYVISRFGRRTSPYSFEREFHPGIDIEAHPGAPIHSTAPGKVQDIRWDSDLGLTVSIKHKYGFETVYSHCQRVTVQQGQSVSKGEVIGYVGSTGKTTRHICYYQIRIGTEFVDPMPYLNRIIH